MKKLLKKKKTTTTAGTKAATAPAQEQSEGAGAVRVEIGSSSPPSSKPDADLADADITDVDSIKPLNNKRGRNKANKTSAKEKLKKLKEQQKPDAVLDSLRVKKQLNLTKKEETKNRRKWLRELGVVSEKEKQKQETEDKIITKKGQFVMENSLVDRLLRNEKNKSNSGTTLMGTGSSRLSKFDKKLLRTGQLSWHGYRREEKVMVTENEGALNNVLLHDKNRKNDLSRDNYIVPEWKYEEALRRSGKAASNSYDGAAAASASNHSQLKHAGAKLPDCQDESEEFVVKKQIDDSLAFLGWRRTWKRFSMVEGIYRGRKNLWNDFASCQTTDLIVEQKGGLSRKRLVKDGMASDDEESSDEEHDGRVRYASDSEREAIARYEQGEAEIEAEWEEANTNAVEAEEEEESGTASPYCATAESSSEKGEELAHEGSLQEEEKLSPPEGVLLPEDPSPEDEEADHANVEKEPSSESGNSEELFSKNKLTKPVRYKFDFYGPFFGFNYYIGFDDGPTSASELDVGPTPLALYQLNKAAIKLFDRMEPSDRNYLESEERGRKPNVKSFEETLQRTKLCLRALVKEAVFSSCSNLTYSKLARNYLFEEQEEDNIRDRPRRIRQLFEENKLPKTPLHPFLKRAVEVVFFSSVKFLPPSLPDSMITKLFEIVSKTDRLCTFEFKLTKFSSLTSEKKKKTQTPLNQLTDEDILAEFSSAVETEKELWASFNRDEGDEFGRYRNFPSCTSERALRWRSYHWITVVLSTSLQRALLQVLEHTLAGRHVRVVRRLPDGREKVVFQTTKWYETVLKKFRKAAEERRREIECGSLLFDDDKELHTSAVPSLETTQVEIRINGKKQKKSSKAKQQTEKQKDLLHHHSRVLLRQLLRKGPYGEMQKYDRKEDEIDFPWFLAAGTQYEKETPEPAVNYYFRDSLREECEYWKERPDYGANRDTKIEFLEGDLVDCMERQVENWEGEKKKREEAKLAKENSEWDNVYYEEGEDAAANEEEHEVDADNSTSWWSSWNQAGNTNTTATGEWRDKMNTYGDNWWSSSSGTTASTWMNYRKTTTSSGLSEDKKTRSDPKGASLSASFSGNKKLRPITTSKKRLQDLEDHELKKIKWEVPMNKGKSSAGKDEDEGDDFFE
ncbi:unnamed protein product [Amoebophrya sp. A120]|nr:unnamed protein product [Amoebophrya sp. A120]|eukprot:GSA120T00010018001.1